MTASTAVVGASIAGVRTARNLRSAGYEGRIVLIGDEDELPYDKPPLSKGLLAGTEEPATLLTEADAERAGISLLLGRPAQRLDLAGRQVELADGERVPFDNLVIATGARARPSPWADLPGVHVLRTLADATRLRESLADGGPLVVVGAGFIGAEVAATARKLGIEEVALVDPMPVPMSRSLSEDVAQRMADLHRGHGVHTRFGTGVAGIEEQNQGLAVRLDDGAVCPARTVVVGIGAVPNDGWLADSGLPVADGVLCDRYGQVTENAGVHAVGDVARWYHPGRDEHVRFEHWTSAVEQAACVAHNIVRPRDRRAHDPVEYVWSDQYDWKIQLAGRTGDSLEHATIDGPRDSFAVLYGDQDHQLAGSVTVNWPRALVTVRKALAGHQSLAAAHSTITALGERNRPLRDR